MSTELDVLEQWDWEQGPGSRYLSSIWHAVLPGIESDYCVQCFNWPQRCTWADQNHMCVCGLAAEELPLTRILPSALCMLKQFFPTVLADATQLPHAAHFPWVSRSDMMCTTVLLWKLTLSSGTLFFQRPSLLRCFSTRRQGGLELSQKLISVYEPNMDDGRLLKWRWSRMENIMFWMMHKVSSVINMKKAFIYIFYMIISDFSQVLQTFFVWTWINSL